ncbi:MAG: hypothetical protein PHY45_03625 [Rhodocyclaceae bacterium]|nr:hypothetical protein [Rhodocyclaceae bacterium]
MRILLLLSICWLGIASAEELAPLSGDEKQLLQDRAKALHEKAEIMRQEAETAFAAENKACWEKFLVSSCQDQAKKTKTQRLGDAHRVDQEAREIDRNLRKRNFAEHEAKMKEEAPQRAADAAAQAEKNRQAQQEAMERVEKKRLEAEQRDKR